MAENSNPTEALAVTTTKETTKTNKRIVENTKSDKGTQVRKYAGLLSIFTFVLSVLIIALAIWLLYMRDYDCEKLLRLPRLQMGIGIGLIFVSLISNIVVFLRSRFPVPGFFLVMVPLIVMFTMGLALVGANKMESRRLVATPMWFREKIRNHDDWENIKSCIFSSGTCDDLVSRSLNLKAFDFSIKKLSSIEVVLLHLQCYVVVFESFFLPILRGYDFYRKIATHIHDYKCIFNQCFLLLQKEKRGGRSRFRTHIFALYEELQRKKKFIYI